MSCQFRHKRPHRPAVIHNLVCQHQVEIEVWPSEAEVYFQDEGYVDPINTQVRFDAVVFNAPSSSVLWEVKDISGGPGTGSIDPTGLYTAPPKGSPPNDIPHGTTDIIVATAVDDPLRKAYARVTLVGFGPAPIPDPKLDLFPERAYLYYPQGQHNNYMDISNTMQIFRAIIRNSASTDVEWWVDGVQVAGWLEPWYRYVVTGSGGIKTVNITAILKDDPGAKDEAIVVQINYRWPGIV